MTIRADFIVVSLDDCPRDTEDARAVIELDSGAHGTR
jgi:hypothetical protein